VSGNSAQAVTHMKVMDTSGFALIIGHNASNLVQTNYTICVNVQNYQPDFVYTQGEQIHLWRSSQTSTAGTNQQKLADFYITNDNTILWVYCESTNSTASSALPFVNSNTSVTISLREESGIINASLNVPGNPGDYWQKMGYGFFGAGAVLASGLGVRWILKLFRASTSNVTETLE